jgi:hypothetical protein
MLPIGIRYRNQQGIAFLPPRTMVDDDQPSSVQRKVFAHITQL